MWDNFFYYDQVPLETQNEDDLKSLMMQEINSLYYDRSHGVDHRYNSPQAAPSQMLVAYTIAQAVAKRNAQVVDGSNGSVDRRQDFEFGLLNSGSFHEK